MRTIATLIALPFVVVVLPLEGRLSAWGGLLVLGGLIVLTLLAFRPQLFRGYEAPCAAIAAGIALEVAPHRITHLVFYSTVAQILPVLFVALAFQSRTFWMRDEMDETSRRMAILVAGALILAGKECLAVLASGNASKGDAQLVVTALVGSTAALVLSAITGGPEPRGAKAAASDSLPASQDGVASDESRRSSPFVAAVAVTIVTAVISSHWSRRRHRSAGTPNR